MATWSSPMSFISFLLFPKGEVRFLYAFCIPLSCTMLRSVYCCCSALRKVFMGQGRMKRYSTSAMYRRAMSVSVVCVFSLVPILSRMTSLFSISNSGRCVCRLFVRRSWAVPAAGCPYLQFRFLQCLLHPQWTIPRGCFPQWLSAVS